MASVRNYATYTYLTLSITHLAMLFWRYGIVVNEQIQDTPIQGSISDSYRNRSFGTEAMSV